MVHVLVVTSVLTSIKAHLKFQITEGSPSSDRPHLSSRGTSWRTSRATPACAACVFCVYKSRGSQVSRVRRAKSALFFLFLGFLFSAHTTTFCGLLFDSLLVYI